MGGGLQQQGKGREVPGKWKSTGLESEDGVTSKKIGRTGRAKEKAGIEKGVKGGTELQIRGKLLRQGKEEKERGSGLTTIIGKRDITKVVNLHTVEV